MLITVTGRRSGRQYSIPVGYQGRGDRLVILVSHADTKQWWRNYREPGPVELRLRGRCVHGQAAVVEPGSRDFRECVEQSFRRMPWLARQFAVRYDRRTGLDDEQLAHLCRSAAVVRVSLEDTQRAVDGPSR